MSFLPVCRFLNGFHGRPNRKTQSYVPAYIDIGRDISTSDQEMLFISQYQGPGFLGVKYAPFMIPNPEEGMPTLKAVAGMQPAADRRQKYLELITGMSTPELREANKVKEYMQVMEDARSMMDSPVKKAFNLHEEDEKTIESYRVDHRFGMGCLLARRLIEQGARFVEWNINMRHSRGLIPMRTDTPHGGDEIPDRQTDWQPDRDLDQRGLLERTLVV